MDELLSIEDYDFMRLALGVHKTLHGYEPATVKYKRKGNKYKPYVFSDVKNTKYLHTVAKDKVDNLLNTLYAI